MTSLLLSTQFITKVSSYFEITSNLEKYKHCPLSLPSGSPIISQLQSGTSPKAKSESILGVYTTPSYSIDSIPFIFFTPSSCFNISSPFLSSTLILNYKIPCSGVISRPAASTSCRSFFITSAGIHLRSTLTVRTRLRLRTMSIGA